MKITERLKGALTALVTPYTADDQVDTKALVQLVKAQMSQGIDGLVPCGTTGETPCLSAAEQELVVRTVVEAVQGSLPVIAGTGSNCTRVTVEQTKRAKAWGIDAALVVCPYYNKPTQEGMFQHFKSVWEETGMPIVAYNVPGRTVSDLLPETIGRLVEVGAIVAVKDATANMTRTAQTWAAVGDRPFALMSGDDFTILPFVASGGHGVISVVSNLVPGETSQLVAASAAGDWAVARPLNARIIALSKALFAAPNPIPVKAGVSLTGIGAKTVRLPLVTADDEIVSATKAAMNAFKGRPSEQSVEDWWT